MKGDNRMEITTIKAQGIEIALVKWFGSPIADLQSALDLIATVGFEAGTNSVILNKEALSEDFFDLRSGLAGEILQKFINYRMKVAIVGDFSAYTSKSLRDFIYECNGGRDLFFVAEEETAVERLINANS